MNIYIKRRLTEKKVAVVESGQGKDYKRSTLGRVQRTSVRVQHSSVRVQRSSVRVQGSSDRVQRSSVRVQRRSVTVQHSSVSVQHSSVSVQRSSVFNNNNLVPFPALFLIYLFYFYSTVFYKIHPHLIFLAGVILPALSNHLRWASC